MMIILMIVMILIPMLVTITFAGQDERLECLADWDRHRPAVRPPQTGSILYIYIYIYIEREREMDRERCIKYYI